MSKTALLPANRLLLLSSRLYGLLLFIYPPHFRDEYGSHMAQVFRDCCREAYQQSKTFGLLCLWVSALADLIVTALEERLASHGGPGQVIQKIGVGLAAGMAGGVVAGLGARLAMRGVAYAGGLGPNFTLGGTFVILAIGLILGAPFGLAFVSLQPWIPGAGLWKGLSYGVLLFVIFLAPPFLFYREGEALLATPLVTVVLFAPVALAYGLVVQFTAMRLERNSASAEALPATGVPSALSQVLWFVVFVVLLELAVLGVTSILNHSPRIPPAIVRTLSDIGLPFSLYRDANIWLINLIALAYFGLSGLIFWQHNRSPMTRFTAITLLLFGSALFNTGAGYYASLIHDVRILQSLFGVLQAVGATCLLILLYVFPNGRFAIKWTRPLAALWLLWAVVWAATNALWPEAVTLTIPTLFLLSGVAAQIQRYRRLATAEERGQTRWAVMGFAGAIAGFTIVAAMLLLIPGLRLPRVTGLSMPATFSLYMLPWLFIPLTIGWAMRRHRLWAT